MRDIAYAVVGVLWWIAVWNLIDIWTADWPRGDKLFFFGTVAAATTALALLNSEAQKFFR